MIMELYFPVSIHLDINSFRDVHVIHRDTLSESTEQNILSRLTTGTEDEQSDNTSNALIDD